MFTEEELRLRLAVDGAKYSPDQPRDDHGRFGSIDGGSVATTNMPKGWANVTSMADAVDGAAPVMNEAERWQTHDGQLTMRFAPEAKISEAQKTHLAETLSTLRATNPLSGPLTVMVVPPREEQYGETIGKSVITMGSDAFHLDPTAPHVVGQLDAGREWHLFVSSGAPEARTTRPADYVVTHEYGHAIEADRYGTPDGKFQTPAEVETAIHTLEQPSSYGNWYKNGEHEVYAEAFAEWYLSGGQTKVPMAQRLAELEGWKPDKSRRI